MSATRLRRAGALTAAALVLGLVTTHSPATAAPRIVPVASITLLNLNDFHGRIDANTVKLAGTIEQQRALAGESNTLLLSAGDNIGASLFASATLQDQPTIDVLNALDLAASAVGNHEFDTGWPDLRDRIIDGGNNAEWSYLAANVYDDGGDPILPEYAIFTVAGETVGVIGVVTDETPTLVSPLGVAGLTFGDPVEAVNRVAAQLSDNNPTNGEASILVAEYHDGAGAGIPEGSTIEQEVAAGGTFAAIVNETSPLVDAIFTGHTHKQYAWDVPVPGQPGITRPIVQTGSYGERVGKVVLTIDVTTKAVTGYTKENVARTATADADLVTAYPRVAAVKPLVDAALANAAIVGGVEVGDVSNDITTAFSGGSYVNGVYTGGVRDDRAKESTLANLVSDSMLSVLSDPLRGGAQIAVMNPGGVRNELLFAPDGTVTYAEANAVLPFANSLFTITLTGAQFKTLLEQQWQRLPNNTIPSRPYLQLGLSNNVSYTYDASLAEGSRITSITVNGAPIDPAAPYRVGSNGFLLEGGDNFHIFKQGTDRADSGFIDRDGWISYITASSPLSPDFSRQAVGVTPLPTTATVDSNITFAVSGLDLTSLGSPQNTSLAITLGGKSLGTVPVTNGAASIDVQVPRGTALGAQQLQLVASPSNTTVNIPVQVGSIEKPAYTPIEPAPVRVVDTRNGVGASAPLQPFTEFSFTVTGLPGVADDALAVGVNLTATDATAAGWMSAYPCGAAPSPITSNLNYAMGYNVANAAIVPVGANGKVCVISSSVTDLLVDVQGSYSIDTDFVPAGPTRLADSRIALGIPTQLVAGKVYELSVAGANGVAADAVAVAVNLTATASPNAGFVTAFPCGTPVPPTSNLNLWPGNDIANLAIVALGSGKLCIVADSATHLIVDLQGSFAKGGSYHPVTPFRAFDSRATGSKVPTGTTVEVPVRTNGVAADAQVVTLNVTATGAADNTYITVWACATPRPTTSNNNASSDRTVATTVLSAVAANGKVCVYTNNATHLVVDVAGWQDPVRLV